MNDLSVLIPVSSGEGEILTVNARELWAFLGSKQQFGNWMQNRIEQYGFEEGVDFTVITKLINNPNGGAPLKEYHVSLDMAKELAMVEKTVKGKEARQYFIACEKKLKETQGPKTYLESLKALVAAEEAKMLAIAHITELEEQIEEDKPYTILGKAITGDHTMTRREWVALMKDEHGLGAKEKQVTKFLMEEGYLYRDQATGETRAYAKSSHLFKLEYEVINGFPRSLLKITGNGILTLTPVVLLHFGCVEE